MANEYLTLVELKGLLGIDAADTSEDAPLNLACEAASRAIDRFTGDKFWLDPAPVTRHFTADGSTWVRTYPIGSIDGLVVKVDADDDLVFEGTLVTGTDFVLWPVDAALDGEPYRRLLARGTTWPTTSEFPPVQVTARFGWPAVPAGVKQAAGIQAARYFKRKDSPFGVAGASDVSTIMLRAQLDPDVQELLRSFKRGWWAL